MSTLTLLSLALVTVAATASPLGTQVEEMHLDLSSVQQPAVEEPRIFVEFKPTGVNTVFFSLNINGTDPKFAGEATIFNPTSSGFAAVEESGKTKLIFTNYTSNTSPVSPTSNKVELVSWDVEAQTADILVTLSTSSSYQSYLSGLKADGASLLYVQSSAYNRVLNTQNLRRYQYFDRSSEQIDTITTGFVSGPGASVVKAGDRFVVGGCASTSSNPCYFGSKGVLLVKDVQRGTEYALETTNAVSGVTYIGGYIYFQTQGSRNSTIWATEPDSLDMIPIYTYDSLSFSFQASNSLQSFGSDLFLVNATHIMKVQVSGKEVSKVETIYTQQESGNLKGISILA